MVPPGEADFLLVLEPSEVEVTRPLLRPGGVLLAPDLVLTAALPEQAEPERRASRGSQPVTLDLPAEALLDAVRAALPARLHRVNEQAFALAKNSRRGRAQSASREPDRLGHPPGQ